MAKAKQILKDSKALGGRTRKLMPRPTVFADKTKYNRAREKQNRLRFE